MAEKYQVDAFGGQFHETIEAGSQHEAREKALDYVEQDFRSSASVHEPSVFNVSLKYGGVSVGVLAFDEHEAADLARTFVEAEKEALLDEVGHGRARTMAEDIRTDVKCTGLADRDTYEINQDGEWDEGSL